MSIEELVKYLLTPVAQVALIIGVAEVIKRQEWFSKKYIPLIDIALGLLSGVGFYGVYQNYGIVQGIMIGLALGLSACGLFSGVKNLTEIAKEKPSEEDDIDA